MDSLDIKSNEENIVIEYTDNLKVEDHQVQSSYSDKTVEKGIFSTFFTSAEKTMEKLDSVLSGDESLKQIQHAGNKIISVVKETGNGIYKYTKEKSEEISEARRVAEEERKIAEEKKLAEERKRIDEKRAEEEKKKKSKLKKEELKKLELEKSKRGLTYVDLIRDAETRTDDSDFLDILKDIEISVGCILKAVEINPKYKERDKVRKLYSEYMPQIMDIINKFLNGSLSEKTKDKIKSKDMPTLAGVLNGLYEELVDYSDLDTKTEIELLKAKLLRDGMMGSDFDLDN